MGKIIECIREYFSVQERPFPTKLVPGRFAETSLIESTTKTVVDKKGTVVEKPVRVLKRGDAAKAGW